MVTLTYQNLQQSRVPLNSILGFIIRTYKKVGLGRLRKYSGTVLEHEEEVWQILRPAILQALQLHSIPSRMLAVLGEGTLYVHI